jgi:hypothetical protein
MSQTFVIANANELHRLATMLETIDRSLERGPPHREALKKAGIALSLGFIRALRSDIERQFEQFGTPLTDSTRTRLRSTGIDPERTFPEAISPEVLASILAANC